MCGQSRNMNIVSARKEGFFYQFYKNQEPFRTPGRTWFSQKTCIAMSYVYFPALIAACAAASLAIGTRNGEQET